VIGAHVTWKIGLSSNSYLSPSLRVSASNLLRPPNQFSWACPRKEEEEEEEEEEEAATF
jgi:hypothetical protein